MKLEDAEDLALTFRVFEKAELVVVKQVIQTEEGWAVQLVAKNITTQQIEWAIEAGGTPSVMDGHLTWL